MSLYNRIVDLQKLRTAWQHVRKNHAAAGVDGMTSEQFDANSEFELKRLRNELEEGSYTALPVRQVTIYRDEKARDIALYSMRDKVVQQCIAAELTKIYENDLADCVYSYRSNRSALAAVSEIERQIQTGQYKAILKTDIRHFFDEIVWSTLKRKLQDRVREEDVMELIRQNCCGQSLDVWTGDLEDKMSGIYQGSGISPILSNIYMMEFDAWCKERTACYIRYADDILILGDGREELLTVVHEMDLHLQQLGLRRNEKKTFCNDLTAGVNFLGYHFCDTGKSIPVKAEESLQNRLESMWITSADIGFEEKIRKALEITGGWEQYYRGERDPKSIYEYICMLYGAGEQPDDYEALRTQRLQQENICRDIMLWLSDYWRRHEDPAMELLEYEEFYQVPRTDADKIQSNPKVCEELLSFYRQYLVSETAETATEIIQLYTDLGEFETASRWHESMSILEKASHWNVPDPILAGNEGQETITFNEETPGKILHTFIGREDLYGAEGIGKGGKRLTETKALPMTERQLREHLKGNHTYGTYVQRANATVHFIVVDVDISRRVLLQYPRSSDSFRAYLEKARDQAAEVCKVLQSMGLKGYIEYSGNRGYHVWLFLTEWMSTRYANMFCDVLESKLSLADDITMEFFPNKTKVRTDRFGQTIKIPYGIHVKTGERSVFYQEDGSIATDINQFIDGLAKFSVGAIKKVIAMNSQQPVKTEMHEVDRDLSAFGELSESMKEVLLKCNLVRYLCQKAAKTGYLTHFERLTLLYVFGHMGEEGRRFLHKVMSFTLNYSYNITERFIQRCPEKPISCVKLQEQYKKVTAEIGCNCVFRQRKNCYPSPVMHAIVRNGSMEKDITVPTSRNLTKEKKQQTLDELNIYKKSQELAKQIQDLNKQKRGLERKIAVTEKELSTLFDGAGIDSLEVEMGLLTRKKENGKEVWVIEI